MIDRVWNLSEVTVPDQVFQRLDEADRGTDG